MKKLFVLLLLTALLASSTLVAFAGSATKLLEVRNDHNMVYFIFEVKGDFTRAELNVPVQVVNGGQYMMYCAQQEDDIVVCTATTALGDKDVRFVFGGSGWSAHVPETPEVLCPHQLTGNYGPAAYRCKPY